MTNIKKTARIAGAAYLITSLILMFSYFLAGENMIVNGDTTATLNNINVNIGLFWAGTATFFIGYAGFILTAAVICKLFKPTHAGFSKSVVVLMVFGVIIVIAGKIAGVAAVYANSFDASTRLLNIQLQGEMAAELFWGLWLAPIAFMIFKSSLMPKIIGAFLLGACVQHITVCAAYFLGFSVPEIANTILLIVSMIGEFGFAGYAITKGVQTKKGAV